MYSFKLNNTKLTRLPIGFENLLFKREVSPVFNGFISRRKAFADSVNSPVDQLTFETDDAIAILLSSYKKDKYNAKVTATILLDNQEQYSGLIDFKTASWNKNTFTCSLTDDETTSNFISKANNEYSISTNQRLLLRSKNIKSQLSRKINEIDANIRIKTRSSIGTIKLPFEKEEKSSSGRFYYVNETNQTQTLKIFGLITGLFSGLGSFRLGIVYSTSESLKQYSNTTSEEEFSLTISKQFKLNPSEGFYLELITSSKDVTIALDSEATYLVIQEVNDYEDSYTFGLTAYQTIIETVKKIDHSLSVSFTDKSKEFLTRFFITNGKSIRSYRTELKTSLASLFRSLDRIFSLRLDLIDNTVLISCFFEENRPRITLSDIINIDYATATEMAFSSIEVGYNEWKSDNNIGGQEFNTSRIYESDTVGVSNKIDMRSSIIASGQIIEDLRIMQFDNQVSENTDNKFDDSLFGIVCYSDGSEFIQLGSEDVSEIKGVLDVQETPTNITITPARILQNHHKRLSGITNKLTFLSGFGNNELSTRLKSSLISLAENEDQEIKDKGFDGEMVTIETYSNISEYIYMTDEVEFKDGLETKKVLVQSVEIAPSSTNSTMVLSGYILAN